MNRVQNLKSKSALLLCELTFLLGLELTDTHRDSGHWEARVYASVYWNDNAMWIKYAPPLPIQFRIILFSLFFIPPSTLGQRASQQNTRPLYGDHAFKRAPFFRSFVGDADHASWKICTSIFDLLSVFYVLARTSDIVVITCKYE